jgi:predicted kinase
MTLVVLAGLPGAGKSTLAARIGAALPAPVLAVDAVERVLHDHGLPPGAAGYGVVAALAAAQLALGHDVVVDAVNPVAAARATWTDLAAATGVPLRFVEVRCGDPAEHRRRVEQRLRRDPGAATWAYAVARRAEYEPWSGPRLLVDTALPGDPLDAVLVHLRGPAHRPPIR